MNDWREHVCKQEKSRCLEFFDNLSSCINIIFDHDELLNIPFNKQNFRFFFPSFSFCLAWSKLPDNFQWPCWYLCLWRTLTGRHPVLPVRPWSNEEEVISLFNSKRESDAKWGQFPVTPGIWHFWSSNRNQMCLHRKTLVWCNILQCFQTRFWGQDKLKIERWDPVHPKTTEKHSICGLVVSSSLNSVSS